MKQPATLSLALASMLLAAVPAAAIVGGNPTTPDQHPHYVRLLIHKYADPAKSSECGASVIDPHWILTAAHCITDGLERNGITIDVFINFCDPCQEVAFNATDLIMHPLWDEDYTHGHDLALLRVATGVTVATDTVRNVQVGAPADPGAYANGVIATVVGHGATHEGGPLTAELNDLHTPLHSDAFMDDIYTRLWVFGGNWIPALMIGAGWTNHTVCSGDSGGPLTVDRNGVTVQVGVASFSSVHWYDPDDPTCDQPGGYAELSGAQMAWVAATVPGVAARWGTCTARLVGHSVPGRWVATYVDTGSDSEGPDKDGPFRWSVSCVPTTKVVTYPVIAPSRSSTSITPITPSYSITPTAPSHSIGY